MITACNAFFTGRHTRIAIDKEISHAKVSNGKTTVQSSCKESLDKPMSLQRKCIKFRGLLCNFSALRDGYESDSSVLIRKRDDIPSPRTQVRRFLVHAMQQFHQN